MKSCSSSARHSPTFAGPFIAEGVIQGGMGAVVAIVLLLATFAAIRARFGAVMADAVGLTGMAFVPVQLLLLLVVGGMALGCLGGFVVARGSGDGSCVQSVDRRCEPRLDSIHPVPECPSEESHGTLSPGEDFERTCFHG